MDHVTQATPFSGMVGRPKAKTYFLSANLRARWTELNDNGHMHGSKCNLKTHIRNLGYPLPLQIGGPKTTFFGRLRNLTANLTSYIFGMKHDIDNLSSALTTTRCLLHCPKTSWTLVHKQLQTPPAFLLTLCKFRIPLHCQASQTEISQRNSTTLCQTVDHRPL